MRCLHVSNDVVMNIVEYAGVVPEVSVEGHDVVPDGVPGVLQVGSPFNMTTQRNTTNRTAGSAMFDDVNSLGKALRAEAAVLVDEINTLRQWIVSFKAAVAASSTFADFKTRTAALAGMPDRTLAQAKTAIQNKIAGGTVD